jgi:hypothetical protein
MKDVSQSTVDGMTKRIVDNAKGKLSAEKARQIARDSANRVNARRRSK